MSATAALRLADEISHAILAGEFPPGTRLDEAGLAARFGLSRTPVREALAEVCARGLAELRPYRGVEVILPERGILTARFEAMAEIEALCAGLAAHRITLDGNMALTALLSRMQSAGSEAYSALNQSFHALVCELSGNAELARMAHDLRLRLEVIRRMQLSRAARQAASLAEHRAIVAAITARDAPGAAGLMRQHLTLAATRVLALLDVAPAEAEAAASPQREPAPETGREKTARDLGDPRGLGHDGGASKAGA